MHEGKSKVIPVLVFFAVLCTAVISMRVRAYEISGFYQYEVNAKGVVITKYTGGEIIVEVPSKIAGKTVTEIGRSAFEDNDLIEEVKIPNTVTAIGQAAFYDCDSLVKIVIPDSVKQLEYETFRNCDKLTTVNTGNGVKQIIGRCFRECASLTNVILGKSLEGIGEQVFYNSDSLNSITIPSSVKRIGMSAFEDCDNLQNVNLTFGLNTIEQGAFYNCKKLEKIIIPDSVTDIEYEAFKYCEKLTTLVIGNGVKKIGDRSFRDCSSLKNVTFGKAVENIGGLAFYNCDSLTSITIPASVKEIKGSCFEDCDNLQTVNLSYGLDVIAIGAFYNCKNLKEIIIPNSVRVIGYEAFRYCEKLEKILIPNSVTTIDDRIVNNCENAIISGYAGSRAAAYADEKKLQFQELKAVPSSSFIFSKKEVLMAIGEKKNLEYSIAPVNSTDAIIWKSSNENIASVDNTGAVTAKGVGSVSIVAATTSGKRASITVIVKEAPKTIIFKTKNMVLAVGDKYAEKAVIDAGRTDVSVAYRSSNTSVATVSSDGVATALKAGTVAIIARLFNGLETYYVITVKNVPTSVSFANPAVSLKLNQTYNLQAVIPSETYTSKYTYTSSDSSIVSVDGSGKITAKKKGSATITVTTHNGKKSTCKVTVN